MADTYWNAMVPELTVRDVAVSLAFYRVLGFAVRFQRSGILIVGAQGGFRVRGMPRTCD